MGLLDTIKRNAKSLLTELDPRTLLDFGQGQTLQEAMYNRMQPGSLRPNLSPEEMVNAGLNIAGVAPIAHTVYHGSPHKFNKFDMSKIGTGEGAQAYGHGLYFAEAPKVADEYAGKLSKKIVEFKNKKPATPEELEILKSLETAANTTQYGAGFQQVRDSFAKYLKPSLERFDPLNPKANAYNKMAPLEGEELAKAMAYRDAAQRLGEPDLLDSGFLYKVDIPDESIPRMLDWDKPLSEQPENVITAIDSLGKIYKKGSWPYTYDYFPKDYSGKDIYKALSISDQASALKMKELGIPGIRYLDGGSRSAGEGTSNFVLFDDQLPRIL